MKILNVSLVFILVVLCNYTMIADSGAQSGGPKKNLVLKPGGGTSSRPKVPSMQQVSVLYEDEYLYIDFLIPEGLCEMSLVNLTTGENVYAYFDSENPEPIYVGALSTATITVTTETGHVYQGEW